MSVSLKKYQEKKNYQNIKGCLTEETYLQSELITKKGLNTAVS